MFVLFGCSNGNNTDQPDGNNNSPVDNNSQEVNDNNGDTTENDGVTNEDGEKTMLHLTMQMKLKMILA